MRVMEACLVVMVCSRSNIWKHSPKEGLAAQGAVGAVAHTCNQTAPGARALQPRWHVWACHASAPQLASSQLAGSYPRQPREREATSRSQYQRWAAGRSPLALTLFCQLHQPIQAHRLAIQQHPRCQLPARQERRVSHDGQVKCTRQTQQSGGTHKPRGSMVASRARDARGSPQRRVPHAAVQVRRQLHFGQAAAEG